MADPKPRVLIVEDDALVALEMVDVIRGCGCVPVGPVATVAAALNIVQVEPVTAAVLDVNLGDEHVWPVADALDARDVPYVLVTASSRVKVPERFTARPFISKPVRGDSVREILAAIGLC